MEKFKAILELVYFLSGPIIAYFAYKALGQITETKKQVNETKETRQINAKRESFEIAAEKCEYFMSTIIPLINNLDRAVSEKEITFFEKSTVEMTNDGIRVKPHSENTDEINKVFELPNLELFNPLESFALFFVSGVAEEKVGYLAVGHTYCRTVKRYAPLLVRLSENKHFNNTLALFSMWNQRIEKEELEKEKAKIDKKLSETKDISINAIGTN
jgi:hypothetical protein